jgi:acetoin utilization protein AcuB
MTSPAPTVEAEATVGAALSTLEEEGLLGVPVLRDGELAGVATYAALVAPLTRTYGLEDEPDGLLDGMETTVGEVVDGELRTCTDTEGLADACHRMVAFEIPTLAVTRGGGVVGVLTAFDVVRAVARLGRSRFLGSGEVPRVADWMTVSPFSVERGDPVWKALELMAEQGVRHLLVTQGGRLCGVVSNMDILRSARSGRRKKLELDLHNCTVGQIMSSRPHTTTPETPLPVAAASMSNHRVNALPVLEGESLVGVLTTRDLLAALCACWT